MYQVTLYDPKSSAIQKVIPAETFDDGVASLAKTFADNPDALKGCLIDASWKTGDKLGALSVFDEDGVLIALLADADFAPTTENDNVIEAVNALTLGRRDLLDALFKPEGLAAFAAEEATLPPRLPTHRAPAWP